MEFDESGKQIEIDIKMTENGVNTWRAPSSLVGVDNDTVTSACVHDSEPAVVLGTTR